MKLNVRIGDETHAAWMTHCQEHGVTSSEVIREFIENRVSRQLPPLRPGIPRKAQKKKQVNVSFTESEIEGIRLRTMLNGGTRGAWIIKVVRAALTRQPVFDDAESSALRESNYQLLAVGKNLNQIARRLNEHQKAEQALDVQEVRELIIGHVEMAQMLIDVNRSRWDIQA